MNYQLTHPWSEFPFGNYMKSFAWITRMPTYAGYWNYDKDVEQQWLKSVLIRIGLHSYFSKKGIRYSSDSMVLP